MQGGYLVLHYLRIAYIKNFVHLRQEQEYK